MISARKVKPESCEVDASKAKMVGCHEMTKTEGERATARDNYGKSRIRKERCHEETGGRSNGRAWASTDGQGGAAVVVCWHGFSVVDRLALAL